MSKVNLKTFIQSSKIPHMKESNYNIYQREPDVAITINRLHKADSLSIAILDTGTKDDLRKTLSWYTESLNAGIHVITRDIKVSGIEELRREWPTVSWIVFHNFPSLGEKLNAMAVECRTSFFAVVRSDTDMVHFDWDAIFSQFQQSKKLAAIAPVIMDKHAEVIPTVRVPYLSGKRLLDPIAFLPSSDKPTPTLYPFLGLAVYNTAIFRRIFDYDTQISGDYWQTMDWGGRAWLYGHGAVVSKDFVIQFVGKESVIEDRSPVNGYKRCLTKLLSVQGGNGDRNYVRPFVLWFDRKAIQDDVKRHLAMYKTDMFQLTERWKAPKSFNH